MGINLINYIKLITMLTSQYLPFKAQHSIVTMLLLLLLLPVREVVQRLVLLLAVVMVATIPLQAEAKNYKMGDKVSE